MGGDHTAAGYTGAAGTEAVPVSGGTGADFVRIGTEAALFSAGTEAALVSVSDLGFDGGVVLDLVDTGTADPAAVLDTNVVVDMGLAEFVGEEVEVGNEHLVKVESYHQGKEVLACFHCFQDY